MLIAGLRRLEAVCLRGAAASIVLAVLGLAACAPTPPRQWHVTPEQMAQCRFEAVRARSAHASVVMASIAQDEVMQACLDMFETQNREAAYRQAFAEVATRNAASSGPPAATAAQMEERYGMSDPRAVSAVVAALIRQDEAATPPRRRPATAYETEAQRLLREAGERRYGG